MSTRLSDNLQKSEHHAGIEKLSRWITNRPGLKPMQPVRLHWAPRLWRPVVALKFS